MAETDDERIARQVRESRAARESEEQRIAEQLRREIEGGAS